MKSKSQQTGLGIALGAAVGVALGVAAGNIAIWVAIGVAIGMALGSTLRRKGIDCPECASIIKRTTTTIWEAEELKADGS